MRGKLIEFFLLAIILVFAFGVRLYKIDNPLADWHSWRQADTSAVSRNFLKFGFDFLHPRFDDLSSLPSGLENPQGYRLVEFPLYNFFQAITAQTFPQKSIDWWGRMVSILFSLGSIVVLYLLVKRYLGRNIGLLSAFFFGFLPYNIYYSRAVLPEPMMIFTLLLTLFFFAKWVEGDKFHFLFYVLSIILGAMTLLLKPFTVFFFLPLLYLVWRRWQFGLFKKPLLYLYLFCLFLPLILWRVWISQYPEGIPNFIWLLNHVDIRFKGAFFRWLFGERIGKLILGFWGLPILVMGILAKPERKEGWFFHFWFLGIILYFSVVASGNVYHDYYQILIIPTVAVFLAKGVNFLLNPPQIFNRFTAYCLLLTALLFMFSFSWYEVREFFKINHPEIVEAGQAADSLFPKSAKVIAPYNGDTAFLYQTNRRGWPAINEAMTIEYLISRGATHFVSVNFDSETKKVMENYKILKRTEKFVIVDLTIPQ